MWNSKTFTNVVVHHGRYVKSRVSILEQIGMCCFIQIVYGHWKHNHRHGKREERHDQGAEKTKTKN